MLVTCVLMQLLCFFSFKTFLKFENNTSDEKLRKQVIVPVARTDSLSTILTNVEG